MRTLLVRILLAAAVTLAAFVAVGRAQQADEDAAPMTPHQREPLAPAQPSTPQRPATGADQKTAASNSNDETQDALAFTGRVVKQRGVLVLSDPVTRMIYQMDNPSKVKPYVGRRVKIVGKLELKSNTIHIESVELVP
jgi:hypothetical protein